MKTLKLNEYTKGWLIGDFEPSVIKTDQFEFSIKKYAKGDKELRHYHKVAREMTVVVTGIFEMNSVLFKEGDIILLEPGEESIFSCIESGYTAVIKMPSVKGDKYIIN